MKRTCITFLLLIIIIVTVACGSGTNVSADRSVYLRMHIRANSNSEEDQRVKYLVRDAVVACLTPIVADCTSKEQVADMLRRMLKLDKEELGKFLDATDALGAAFCHFLQMSRPQSEAKHTSWKELARKQGKI